MSDVADHEQLLLQVRQALQQVRQALQNEDYEQAISGLLQSTELARTMNDPAAEGRHLGNLALIYYRTKRPDLALDCFNRALILARADNDRLTEDGILGNMGNILRELGRFDEALAYLDQALIIAQEIGDTRGRGIWLSNLGLVFDDLHRNSEAIEVHRESVSVARQMRDQRSLTARLSNLGNSHLAQGELTEAIKCFHEIVSLYKSLGNNTDAALRLGIIGNIYNDLGRKSNTEFEARFYYELARDTYIETLRLAQELGDKVGEGDLLTSLGTVYGNMGEYELAFNHFTAAQQIFAELNLSDRQAYAEENLRLAQDLMTQAH
ncbi:MAG: tetratricopeptide repeat protein [Anaerolineaceae bacterium]|nr:tetratricopeptide repeat protein [Anaerolineaceae bacterium]